MKTLILVFFMVFAFVRTEEPEETETETTSALIVAGKDSSSDFDWSLRLTNLELRCKELENKNANLEATIIASTLKKIQDEGIKIGSRWIIHEEKDVFVIRDLKAYKDGRFAGFPNRYRDW